MNRKVLRKIEPKKKKKIFIECFRYDWNVHKNKKRVTHFPESDTVRPAAFSSKIVHDKAHLSDFCRRHEKFTLKSHRSKLRWKLLSLSSEKDPGKLQPQRIITLRGNNFNWQAHSVPPEGNRIPAWLSGKRTGPRAFVISTEATAKMGR